MKLTCYRLLTHGETLQPGDEVKMIGGAGWAEIRLTLKPNPPVVGVTPHCYEGQYRRPMVVNQNPRDLMRVVAMAEIEDAAIKEDAAITETKGNPDEPNGLDQHEPGAKNDANKDCAALLLSFPRALEAIARVATYGARKYSPNGWQHVLNGQERYRHAMMRHLLAGEYEPRDTESNLPHEWHFAWNVLASLELKLRKNLSTPAQQHE